MEPSEGVAEGDGPTEALADNEMEEVMERVFVGVRLLVAARAVGARASRSRHATRATRATPRR